MAMIYVALITKGLKAFHEVPEVQMAAVAQLLIDVDCGYLIDVEEYQPKEGAAE